MNSPMVKVSELVSSSIGDTLTNIKTWGNVMYNVLEHGLVGDGITDDTAALQTLINTAISAGRKTIFFPHTPTGGKYFVTALTNANQVEFIGDNSSFVGGYSGTISDLGAVANKVSKAGDTMTGALNMSSNSITNLAAPTNANDAARKTDVDAKVSKSGDTMTGNLTIKTGNTRISLIETDSTATGNEGANVTADGNIYFYVQTVDANGNWVRDLFRIDRTNGNADLFGTRITYGNVGIYRGTGSPEGVVTANPGSIYLNSSGGATTALYVKKTGTGNTGWGALSAS